MQGFRAFASAEFSASHRIVGHPECGRQHGHRWRVEVSIRAGQDPKTGVVVGSYELADAVRQLCAELDFDDVNTMLPGPPPTAEGIALAFNERLSMNFSDIESITVTMDGAQGVTLS